MQDVIDRVKVAEQRAHDAEQRIQAHERESAAMFTRVAVLESRYTDLKGTMDTVVQTQGAQGEQLARISTSVESIREDIRSITSRVWAGSAAGAGGTGMAAILIWYLLERGGTP